MANTGKSNPGNFSNDREKASQAGKKGGQASGAENAGNMSNDRAKTADKDRADTSKKGGQGSHGGGRS
ncbi:MAG: KGG domain-containing protein [Pseudomonas sp.]|uniref:KGG domain-containing protein n=1 Tax=Pseudomonas abieticivorans TaxID=2931382 RepID=UPI0020BFEFAF|nr:KGG domain-containing protein [Pseudomonas sp. PIA16]MDE1167353.1 KGG domain-containing protein [Pseudomonas sp.]